MSGGLKLIGFAERVLDLLDAIVVIKSARQPELLDGNGAFLDYLSNLIRRGVLGSFVPNGFKEVCFAHDCPLVPAFTMTAIQGPLGRLRAVLYLFPPE